MPNKSSNLEKRRTFLCFPRAVGVAQGVENNFIKRGNFLVVQATFYGSTFKSSCCAGKYEGSFFGGKNQLRRAFIYALFDDPPNCFCNGVCFGYAAIPTPIGYNPTLQVNTAKVNIIYIRNTQTCFTGNKACCCFIYCLLGKGNNVFRPSSKARNAASLIVIVRRPVFPFICQTLLPICKS